MRKQIVLVTVAAMVFCIGGLMGCSSPEEENVAAPTIQKSTAGQPVTVMTVPPATGGKEWVSVGVSSSSEPLALSFDHSGKLARIFVREGQDVDKGMTLAELESKTDSKDVRQLKENIKVLKAQLADARVQEQKMGKLLKQEIISKKEYDVTKELVVSIEAELDGQEKMMDTVQESGGGSRLVAPERGYVSALPVEPGAQIVAGQPVVMVNANRGKEMLARIPQKLLPYVREGDATSVTFDVFREVHFAARVEFIGQTEATGLIPVRVLLEKADARVRDGMEGEVHFSMDRATDFSFVRVPDKAVFGEPGGNSYVWLVDQAAQTVSRSLVDVATRREGQAVLFSGVSPGDMIVTSGVYSLEDGQSVEVK